MRQPFTSRFAAPLRSQAAARAAAGGATADDEAARKALERIRDLSQVARGAWFGLIAYLAFVALTLLGVRDIDFFSLEARTDLPLVGVAIPTRAFFWAAPLLGLALHAWLHLHLVKLWDALADAPATVEGARLGERMFPWLVNDWALRRRPDAAEAAAARPLAWLGDAVAAALVWWAAPALIAWAWLRSMPALEEWLTLPIGLMLALAIYVSVRSLRRAVTRLKQRDRPDEPPLRRRGALAALALLLTAFGWLRTEGGFDHHGAGLAAWLSDRRTDPAALTAEEDMDREDRHYRAARAWAFDAVLASADLRGVDLARRPTDWVSRETAERRFRTLWCRDRALPPDACHPPRRDDYEDGWETGEAAYAAARAAHARAEAAWCAEPARAVEPEACAAHLAGLRRAFAEEWAEVRAGELEDLAKPTMSGRDLRGADLSGAFLTGLELAGARMEGVDLFRARMEGVNLSGARMEAANLREARMERANLYEARMERANLWGARMEGVNLRRARMEGATLVVARMEGVNLSGARMEGASLGRARMEGVNLSGARMEEAKLFAARMEGADLRGARMEGAYLSEARMEGADLSGAQLQSTDWVGAHFGALPAIGTDFTAAQNLFQDQLDLVIGDERSVLGHDAVTGAQLHIWSCWETPPPGLDSMLERAAFGDPARIAALRAQWLCSDANPRRKVGRRAEP